MVGHLEGFAGLVPQRARLETLELRALRTVLGPLSVIVGKVIGLAANFSNVTRPKAQDLKS